VTRPARQPALLRVGALACSLSLLLVVQSAVLYVVLYTYAVALFGSGWPALPFVLQFGVGGLLLVAAVGALWRGRREHVDTAAAAFLGGGLVLLALASGTSNGWCEMGRAVTAAPHPLWQWDWHWFVLGGVPVPGVGWQFPGGTCAMLVSAVPLALGYVFLGGGLWLADGTDRAVARFVAAVDAWWPTGRE